MQIKSFKIELNFLAPDEIIASGSLSEKKFKENLKLTEYGILDSVANYY
jgi:hypothetical protein